MYDVYKFSSKGNRKVNEDFVYSRDIPSFGSIYLLADGMGGYSHGELAASLVCRIISDYVYNNFKSTDVPGIIEGALQSANEIILNKRKELAAKLGTTIAGVLIIEKILYFFWIGDVRIYHFRNNKNIFQSVDHSLINDIKKNGTVSVNDLTRYKNIVTHAIVGDNLPDQIPIIKGEIIPGDTLIICSDGLWQNWNIESLHDLSNEELEDSFAEKDASNDDNFSMIKFEF